MTSPPPPSTRAATIKDVAARAGVSWKTVTNVVHQRQNVRDSTRQRVLDAIDELGYRPVIAGRQLQKGRSDTITLVISDVVNPYFAMLTDATFTAAAARGYSVFVEHSGGEPSHERHAATAIQRFAFDGVLFSPMYATPKEMAELAERIPVVLLGENVGEMALDVVSIDNIAAATHVTEHLLDSGRRHLAFVGDQTEEPAQTGKLRLRGFTAALDRAGVPAGAIVQVTEFHQRHGYESATRLLATAPDLDAIVCANDLLAIGVLHRLRQAGVRVPHDIAVTGWDNTPDSAYTAPPLTTVDPHIPLIAASAVDLLIDRIEGSRRSIEHIIVPHKLLPRESSAPLGTTGESPTA